jgi:hypothetical protein
MESLGFLIFVLIFWTVIGAASISSNKKKSKDGDKNLNSQTKVEFNPDDSEDLEDSEELDEVKTYTSFSEFLADVKDLMTEIAEDTEDTENGKEIELEPEIEQFEPIEQVKQIEQTNNSSKKARRKNRLKISVNKPAQSDENNAECDYCTGETEPECVFEPKLHNDLHTGKPSKPATPLVITESEAVRADMTAVESRLKLSDLQQAMVLKEILDKPVALRKRYNK